MIVIRGVWVVNLSKKVVNIRMSPSVNGGILSLIMLFLGGITLFMAAAKPAVIRDTKFT
jgi:hypothetical protein